MVIAGGNAAKFVFYPIHMDPARPQMRLTNWAIMARLSEGQVPPPRREDWNRIGQREEALPFVRDKFRLGFLDPVALIEATETFYEYPNCDRDPLPRWSVGRVTLLGDAAHPMYPVGSNGASQAIVDAQCLARHLKAQSSVAAGFAAYDDERRPAMAKIVVANRKGGPEGVIDLIEARRRRASMTSTASPATPSARLSYRLCSPCLDLRASRSTDDERHAADNGHELDRVGQHTFYVQGAKPGTAVATPAALARNSRQSAAETNAEPPSRRLRLRPRRRQRPAGRPRRSPPSRRPRQRPSRGSSR